MAGPWEQFQSEEQEGPWARFAKPEARPDSAPTAPRGASGEVAVGATSRGLSPTAYGALGGLGDVIAPHPATDPLQGMDLSRYEPLSLADRIDPATGATVPAAVNPAHLAGAARDPARSRELALQFRQQYPDANWAGEALERPGRELGDMMDEVGAAYVQGARSGVVGLLDTPRVAINALNTAANVTGDTINTALGRPVAPAIPMMGRWGPVQYLADANERLTEDERRRTLTAQTKYDEANRPDSFLGTLGYSARHPSSLINDAARTAGIMTPAIVPGSGGATIGVQASSQAAMAADDVERNLLEKGASPEVARAEASKAYTAALGLGLAAPRMVRGGRSFEDMLAGRLGVGAGTRASRVATPILGESASETLEEGGIRAITNVYSGDPVGEGVGGDAALGAALGFGMGTGPAAAEVARMASPTQRAYDVMNDPRASNEQRLEAALDLMNRGYNFNAQEGALGDAISPEILQRGNENLGGDEQAAGQPEPAAQPAPQPAPPPQPAPRPAQQADPAPQPTSLDELLTRNIPQAEPAQDGASPPVIDAERIAAALGDPEPVAPATPPSAPAPPPTAQPDTRGGQSGPVQGLPAMQNRDRKRAASVAQMQDIRRNPDPARLGFSRDSNTGAPMVARGQEIPAQDVGRTDAVVMPDGRRVPVQYAVVEADAVQASHDADGNVNPGYDGAPLQALNNGRTAGLQAAWRAGNANAYRDGIAADADFHGVPAEAIASKRQPVLVRLYDPAENLSGADSNASQQLGLSPVEQAQTDASLLPDLSGITWGEDGSLNPNGNADFFRAWFRNMGETQAATLQDAQGRPNAAALQRVRAAMVQRAYGDERLLTALVEDTNPDNRNVMTALVQAAPAFASLDQGNTVGNLIREALTGGLQMLRDASARGISLTDAIAQQDMFGRNEDADAAAGFMAANARSAKRMAEAFRAMAEYADQAEMQAATLDVFGDAPTPTVRAGMQRAGMIEEQADGRFNRDAGAPVRDGEGQPREQAPGRAAAGDAGRIAEDQLGLFGSPTRREEVDAERRRRDAERDGRTGSGRTDMAAGPGDLFAGRRPEQATIPDRVEEGRDQTQTPAFRRWFGDSKVVDAQGRPLVVYHGTTAPEFDVFQSGSQPHDAGIFFTDSEFVAEGIYADGVAELNIDALRQRLDGMSDAELRAALESARGPGRLWWLPAWDEVFEPGYEGASELAREELAGAIESAYDRDDGLEQRADHAMRAFGVQETRAGREGSRVVGAYLSLQNPLEIDARGDEFDQEQQARWIAQAREEGRDGLIIRNYVDGAFGDPGLGSDLNHPAHTVYIAFRPEQVKSATGNRGTFDPADPSIVREDGDRFGVESSRDMFVTTRGDRKAQREDQSRNRPQDRDSATEAPARRDAGRAGLRPDATPSLTRRGKYAIESLVRRFGGSVLADRIARDFREKDTAQLIGQKVKTPADLAALADVYRNPIFEVLRYIFVDDAGNVVHETAVSARMPSAADIFPAEYSRGDDGLRWLEREAKSKGATGLWLLHNHPSGDPTPSSADRAVTSRLSQDLKSSLPVQGHVVLNHKRYGAITPDGRTSMHTLKGSETPDPLVDVRGDLAGKRLDHSSVARVGKRLLDEATSPDSVVLLTINAKWDVVSVVTLPTSVLRNKRAGALSAMIGKRSAANFQIAVMPEAAQAKHGAALRRALNSGLLTDVITVDKSGATQSAASRGQGGHRFDRVLDRRRRSISTRVYEGDSGRDPLESFAGARAETADQFELAEAKRQIAAGRSPGVVRRETGWFTGHDGMWRFEISDQDAKWNTARHFRIENARPGQDYALGEVLHHPLLFAAYPQFAGMPVWFSEDISARGEYHPRTGAITLNASLRPEEALSTLLHEIQHAIQHVEGFATGGNVDQSFTDAIRARINFLSQEAESRVAEWIGLNRNAIIDAERAAEKLRYGLMWESVRRLVDYSVRDRPSSVFRLIRNEVQWIHAPEFRGNEAARDLQYKFYEIPRRGPKRNAAIREIAFEAAQIIRNRIPEDLRSEFRADPRQLRSMIRALSRDSSRASRRLDPRRELEQEARNVSALRDAHQYSTPYDIYRHLAGEVEARNTQSRQSMTDAERRATPPSLTQDVDTEQVIVTFGALEVQSPKRMADLGQKGQEASRGAPAQEQVEESRDAGEADAEMHGLRDAVERAVGKGRVTFLRGIDGLPERLRQGVQRRLEQRGGRGRTAALYDPVEKQVYLFTDVVTTPERAVWNALHEIAGHHGLREFLGDRLDRALELALQNPTVRQVAEAIARERKIDTKTQRGRLLAAEEALAELAAAVRTGDFAQIESRYDVQVGEGIRERVTKAIENFVRRLKALLDDVFGTTFTDEDVRALLENAWQAAQAGNPTVAMQQADGSTISEQVQEDGRADGIDGPGQEGEYRGGHQAPDSTSGSPLWNVTLNGHYPDDVYSASGLLYYGTGVEWDAEAYSAIQRWQQKPNGFIDVYRAVPKSVKGNKINRGDWVTPVRAYAVEHGEGALAGDYRIQKVTVRPRDLWTNGDSWMEWGYDPQPHDPASEKAKREGRPYVPAPQDAGALESAATDQTQTAAFRRWFGDSKIVDADGDPLVVYHGTATPDRDSFNTDRGAFFSDNPEVSSDYASRTGPWRSRAPVGGVIPAYLSIRNPLEIDALGKRHDNLPVPWQQWKPKQFGRLPENAVSVEGALEYAREHGHDGVIVRNVIDTIDMDGRQKSTVYAVVAPHQIKSATANRGTFDPDSDSIMESVEYTPEQQEFMDKAGVGVDSRGTLQKARDWMGGKVPDVQKDALIQTTLNKYYGLNRAVEAVGGIDLENDPYIATRQINIASTMEAILRFGAPKMEGGALVVDRNIPGLFDSLTPVHNNLPGFFGWMVARRAQVLKRQGRENLMSDADIQAGLSLRNGNEAAFDEAAGNYLRLKNAILDFAEQHGGTIDPEARAAWDHAEYIPFYRDAGEGGFSGPGTRRGLSHQSAGIRQLKGGEQALRDPLQNIIQNFTRLMDSALKNRAMLLAVDQLGAPYFKKAPRQITQATIPLNQVKKHLQDQGVPQATIDAMPESALKGVGRMLAIKPPEGDNIVRVMRNGKAEYYEVLDELVLRSVTALNEKPMPQWFKPAVWAKNLLTAGATSTPDFILRNLFRDTGEAAVTSRERFIPLVDTIKGAAENVQMNEFAQDLMMAGSYFHGGLFHQGDFEATARATKRALRRHGLTDSQAEKVAKTLINPKRWWDVYRAGVEASEMGSRISLARNRMQAGGTFLEAAHEAKDFLDFTLRGDSTALQFLLNAVPFMNARLQGNYRLARMGTAKDRRRAVLMRMASMGMATAALYAWNMLAHREEYEKLQDWDKDAYWHIAPGTDKHIRIPKPFELGLIAGTAVERGMAALAYHFTDGEAGDRADRTMDAAWRGIWETLALNPIPQILKPGFEVYNNKNYFTGRPIESRSDEFLPPADRKTQFTSDTLAAASRGMQATVGEDLTLSPKQLQHLWRGYFGGFGMYFVDAADHVTRALEDAPPKPASRARDLPGIGAIYRGSSPDSNTRWVDEMYDLRDQATTKSMQIKRAVENGETARAERLQREHGWLLGPAQSSKAARGGFMHGGVRELNRATNALAKLRKADNRIYEDREMTRAEKREALDKNARDRDRIAREQVRKIRERQRTARDR